MFQILSISIFSLMSVSIFVITLVLLISSFFVYNFMSSSNCLYMYIYIKYIYICDRIYLYTHIHSHFSLSLYYYFLSFGSWNLSFIWIPILSHHKGFLSLPYFVRFILINFLLNTSLYFLFYIKKFFYL